MIRGINIDELWAYRPNASDLYNIERSVNPIGGGGARYIQIRKSQLQDLLRFLHLARVPDSPVSLLVRSHFDPSSSDVIEFDVKSQDRMRIANQNRNFSRRAAGWSPEAGFPVLGPDQTTEDAETLLTSIGGLRIYLVRDVNQQVWAGFTQGKDPESGVADLPFVSLLYGDTDGGYWRFRD